MRTPPSWVPAATATEEGTGTVTEKTCTVTGHNHGDGQKDDDGARKKLIRATALCFAFMLAELIGGYMAHSLAIMTDAAHLLSDVAGMAISIAAITLARQKSTSSYTFGYHRAEVLGALLSVLLIWSLTAILVYEAILRIITPHQVKGKMMFCIAVGGLVVNLAMLYVLGGHGHSHGGAECHGHGGDEDNINVRAAVIHIIGDLLQTIGVIIAAALIWWSPNIDGIGYRMDTNGNQVSNWCLADPICTCLFAVLVLMTTWGIVKDSVNVLMMAAPKNVKLDNLLEELANLDGVVEVSDVHLWALSPGKNCIACHMRVKRDPMACRNTDDLLASAQKLASEKYHIWNSTFQIQCTEPRPQGGTWCPTHDRQCAEGCADTTVSDLSRYSCCASNF